MSPERKALRKGSVAKERGKGRPSPRPLRRTTRDPEAVGAEGLLLTVREEEQGGRDVARGRQNGSFSGTTLTSELRVFARSSVGDKVPVARLLAAFNLLKSRKLEPRKLEPSIDMKLFVNNKQEVGSP